MPKRGPWTTGEHILTITHRQVRAPGRGGQWQKLYGGECACEAWTHRMVAEKRNTVREAHALHVELEAAEQTN